MAQGSTNQLYWNIMLMHFKPLKGRMYEFQHFTLNLNKGRGFHINHESNTTIICFNSKNKLVQRKIRFLFHFIFSVRQKYFLMEKQSPYPKSHQISIQYTDKITLDQQAFRSLSYDQSIYDRAFLKNHNESLENSTITMPDQFTKKVYKESSELDEFFPQSHHPKITQSDNSSNTQYGQFDDWSQVLSDQYTCEKIVELK